MSKKADAPAPPNPYALSSAQSGLNRQSMFDAARLNSIDQFAPWGSTVFIRDKNGIPIGQSIVLPQNELDFYNTTSDLRNSLADSAMGMTQYLPQGQLDYSGIPYAPGDVPVSNFFNQQNMDALRGFGNINRTVNTSKLPGVDRASNTLDLSQLTSFAPQISQSDLTAFHQVDPSQLSEFAGTGDLSADRKRVEDAMYERAVGLQQRDFDKRQSDLNTMLVERGLPVGSEIDSGERNRFDEMRNEAQQRAAMDAIIYGGDEMQRQFQIAANRRAQEFAEQQGLFGMSAAQRAQEFGEAGDIWTMAAQQRAQQLGEQQALGQEQSRVLGHQNVDWQRMLQGQQAMGQEQNRLFDLGLTQRMTQMGEYQAQAAEQSRIAALMQALRQQGINEYTNQRYEPINLISSFMQGAPSLPTASFMPTGNYQSNSPDFMNAAMQSWQAQANQANSQNNSFMSGLFGLGSAALGGLFSDRRLKSNIRRVGTLDNGLPVYLYEKFGRIEMGVMADEVEGVHPEAVTEVNGFKMVDYERAVA
jgi:hypothetical protein